MSLSVSGSPTCFPDVPACLPLCVGVHAFGLCATALITDVLQLMTGYPTPYFLTVCKPNYTTLNVSCEQNPYVMEDICSGSDPTAINQGRWGSLMLHTAIFEILKTLYSKQGMYKERKNRNMSLSSA